MGKGKTKVEKASSDYNWKMANIAESEYKKRGPLLDQLISRSSDFMNTGDIGASKYFDPIKSSIEDQMKNAQGRVMESMPVGGGMNEAIGELFMQGTTSMLDQLVMKELDNAFILGTGGAPIAVQGLGAAGGNMAQLAGAQSQRIAAEGQNYQMIGGGQNCCFIFISAHRGLHPIVRLYRNDHMTIRNRRGYYWLADKLVPRMEKNKWVMRLVKAFMVDPMTSYGKYYYGFNKTGFIFAPITSFWLRVYSLLGFRPPYRRRGTIEVV